MVKLYVIRHGQASIGSDNYDQLSPVGVRQAHILGEYLAGLDVRFDAVYSGEMERQKDTAKFVLEELYGASSPSLEIAPEFNEYDAHSIIRYQAPELVSRDPEFAEALSKLAVDGRALALVFKRTMLRWVSGEWTNPGVETWPGFIRRIESGLERLHQENGPDKTIAVFTSGGAIGMTLRKALELRDERAILTPLQIYNSAVSLFYLNEDTVSLSYFNCIAHLLALKEAKLITYR